MAHLDFKSVFDELTDETEILKYKLHQNYHTKSDINFTKPIIMEGKLKMNNKKTGKMVTKHFQLCDKKLISYKISNHQILSPNAFYNLLNFYTIYYNEYSESGLHSFTLSKYGKYHEFFSESKAEILKWMEHLRYLCITSTFSEHFELGPKIGKGHFAKVFQVKRRNTLELYAAKIFTKDKAFEDEKNFVRREVYILKKLPRSDRILRLYEIFEDHKELVLIFELLPEGDLYAKLKAKHRFTEIEISAILAQILRGIEFLHNNGVMHRDIKLDNILIQEMQPYIKVKIADFSLAEMIRERNGPLNKCGTPGFMAPEIFSEEAYDERIDVFSAGVILFILLSKITPFKGKNANEILENNKTCNIKFKRSAWENVSKCARKLTMMMLMRNPDDRIRLSQILTNEFVLSSMTYLSDHNSKPNSMVSCNKVKTTSMGQDPSLPDSNSNKTNPVTRGRSANNVPDQNILQLPSALPGYNSSSVSSSINSDQNFLKSINSIFIVSSKKLGGEINSSSILSETVSPSYHFTNTENKKSLNNTMNNTYNSNFFSSWSKSNTLSGNKAANRSMGTRTEKSFEDYSYYVRNDIFMDENPIEDLIREMEKTRRRPHPSKKF